MSNQIMEKIVCKLLKSLGLSQINAESFENRLRYQKIIYLLQYFDLPVGFRFNWYVRGPYSPPLTDIIYSIHYNPSLWEQSREIEFKEENEVEEKIYNLKILLGEKLEDWEYLEIFASLAYIKENNPSMTNDELTARLEKLKPFITDFNNYFEKRRDVLSKLKYAS
jgi:uncharacterized protein YwgA